MSLKDMMHSLIGSSSGQATMTNAALTTAVGQGILAPPRAYASTTKKLFDGRIEVLQVANGYIVNIGRKEGYEYETHIASTITEVNEIINAQIVAFKLEDK